MKVGEIAHPERVGFGKPLEGVRVLSLEQQHAMPFATQLLARLGADVVRVEQPGAGDPARYSYPAVHDPAGRMMGSTFLRNNLDKRSIAVDIKTPAGRDLLLRLAPRFDVFAENFRGGALARAGLGFEDLVKVHPKVVYATVSGYGADGQSPYHGRGAYAPVMEAIAGFYDFKRRPDERPVIGSAGALGDTSSGLFATIGILSALRQRDRTGMGQHVDIAMYDAMVAMVDVLVSYSSLGKDSAMVPSHLTTAFRAKDGFIVMQCGSHAHFAALAHAVGCPQWIGDPRLETPADWGARIDDVIRPEVERWAAQYTRHQAAAILCEAGMAVGPCQSIEEVMSDPHVVSRHMIVEMDRPDGIRRPIRTPGNPIKMSTMAQGPERRVPWLGEHTREVFGQELGLADREIESLMEQGVLG